MKIGAKARKKQKKSICPFVAAVFQLQKWGGDQAILVGVTTRGSGSRAPSRRRPTGVRAQSPDAAAILQLFIQKIRIFRHIMVYISA